MPAPLLPPPAVIGCGTDDVHQVGHLVVEQGSYPQQLRALGRSGHDAFRIHPGAEDPYMLPQRKPSPF